MSIDVRVVSDDPSPTVIVFPGNRGMCSCGWMGKPRWFIYGATIDANIHAEETGHARAVPLVWGNHR